MCLKVEITKELNLKHPFVWVATWFGSGFLHPAPGTWGSLTALPFAVLFFYTQGILIYLIALCLVIGLGFWSAEEFDKASQSHDNKAIVIDEVAGQWIALIPVFYYFGVHLPLIALAFGLFRLFDITKPWPVCYFDKHVKGALGVMGDDIIAGFMAALCIIGVHYAGFS